MTTRAILLSTLINFGLVALTQGQDLSSPTRNRLIIRSDQFASVQQLLDDQAARGYVVSGISYHSRIRDLHSKGRLEIDLEIPATPQKHEYRALITEMESMGLQKALNEYGAKGFRLLGQTPIPLELGLVRLKAMFVAVMEKNVASASHYDYRVVSYGHQPWVRKQISQAVTDGFSQACKHQFGPLTYLVMEKITTNSP